MQDNPSPSALAIRRATRVRELNRLSHTKLLNLRNRRLWDTGKALIYGGDDRTDALIDEILHLEGLDMTVLS